MYGLYPGNVLSAKRTPELIDPIKAVLEQREDGGTGFSRACCAAKNRHAPESSSELAAEASDLVPNTNNDDLAWGIGGEIGDSKEYVKVGMGYWEVQANATFSGFVDSDLFDGKTNRKGFGFYLSKQILENTEFALSTFWSRPIETSLPAYEESRSKAHRVRVEADMQFKF